MNNIAKLIKDTRKEKHLSLRKLKELSGISSTYLNNLENGGIDKRTGKPINLTINMLYNLAKGLELSYSDVVELALEDVKNQENKKRQ